MQSPIEATLGRNHHILIFHEDKKASSATLTDKRAAVLFSGGKDSTYACAKAMESGYEIACLLTMFSENNESYMLHTANIEVTELSARAIGLPRFVGRTAGKKEEEILDIKNTIIQSKEEFGFGTLVTGAIASVYQKDRIERIAKDCALEMFSPLWGVNQERYLRALVSEGYKFVVTSISAEGLDKSWLGREIGYYEMEKLILLSTKFSFNTAFEGGEAETLILDCPIFKNGKIRILDSNAEWNGYFGSLKIKKAILEEK